MAPRIRTLSRYLSLLLPAGIAAAALFAGCSNGNAADDPGCNPLTGCVDGAMCQSNRQFFESQVWAPLMSQQCMKCHNGGGQAEEAGAKLTMQSAGYPNFLDNNLETLKAFSLERTGDKIKLLEKPIGGLNHGGGQVVNPSSPEYAALKELVNRFQSGDPCPDSSIASATGVTQLTASATLRKAAIDLGGRLPTDAETASVAADGAAGEQALDPALDALLNEDVFYARLREMFNDVMLTDKYVGNEIQMDTGDKMYPSMDRFRNDKNPAYSEFSQYRDELRNAMGSEPMNLIAYVARNNLPFTEIVSANYTVVTPRQAQAYGAESQVDMSNPLPQKVNVTLGNGTAVPHAGVLSTPSFLQRWPTTRTNRSRARARRVYEFFLDTDILKVADRPVDPSALTAEQNPTLNSNLCAVCHAKIDPIAGAFRGYDEDAPYSNYDKPEQWHDDMRKAGLESDSMPASSYTTALPWLGNELAKDPRFVTAMVHTVFRGLTGRKPLAYPTAEEADRKLKVTAWSEQDAFFRQAGDAFVASNYNIKSIFKSVIKSVYYRADVLAADPGDKAAAYDGLGTNRWLTPEMLQRKVRAIFGYPWRYRYEWDAVNDDKKTPEQKQALKTGGGLLGGEYKLLYGGMDSDNVPARLQDPNGIASSITWRLAHEMSCSATPYDFWKPRDQRRFFPLVDAQDRPQYNGKEIAESVKAIKDNIVHLHQKILGETVTADSPEVARTYQLFLDTWLELQANEGKEDKKGNLAWECMARYDYDNLVGIPDAQQLQKDPDYTIRSWQAVVAYLMLDYRFLYH